MDTGYTPPLKPACGRQEAGYRQDPGAPLLAMEMAVQFLWKGGEWMKNQGEDSLDFTGALAYYG